MDPVLVKNAVDTWIDENRPDKIIGNTAKLWVSNQAGNRRQALMFFVRPWPIGSTLLTARLKLYQGVAWAGANQLSVQSFLEKWNLNKTKWSNRPGVSGPVASLSQADTPANAEWDIDILPVLQPVSNGAWYGFKITIDTNTARWLHSAQASKGSLRPVLEVTWSEGPDEPDNLRPGGGRAVSKQFPYFMFDYNDTLGDTDLDSVQLEIGTTDLLVNSGAAEWKTGDVAVEEPGLNTQGFAWPAPAWPGINNDQVLWWRSLATDEDGLPSVWSDAVPFTRKTKGVLTITSGDFFNPSPTVTWTFVGRVQKHFQVILTKTNDVNNWLWTSGKLSGTETSYTIPFGFIDPQEQYRVIVRVWDTIEREATPGDPVYVEAFDDAVVLYDAAIAPVTAMQALSDEINPVMHLTWQAPADTDEFAVQRSNDNGVSWQYVAEAMAADWNTGGTNFAFDDATAPQYTTLLWRVVRIEGDRQSDNAPEVVGQIRKIAPFLMRRDGTDVVCFLNPKRERSRLDVQAVHNVMGGPPVLVTQRLGLQAGRVEGRLTADPLPGVTAKQMLNRFRRLREDSGQPMSLLVGDETLKVVAWKMDDDMIIDASGITYTASFEWFEVP